MKCDPTLYRAAPPSLAVKPRLIRQLFLPPLIFLLMIGLGYVTYLVSESKGIKNLSETGERQLELHARTVESEISKYTYLPSVLELESSVSQLLNDPGPELQQQVNRYLEGLTVAAAAGPSMSWTRRAAFWRPATGATVTVIKAKTSPSVPIFRMPCADCPGVFTGLAPPPANRAITWRMVLKRKAES